MKKIREVQIMSRHAHPKPYEVDNKNVTKPISVAQAVVALLEYELENTKSDKAYGTTDAKRRARGRLEKGIKRYKESLGFHGDSLPFEKLHYWACERYQVNRLLDVPHSEFVEEITTASSESEFIHQINNLEQCNVDYNREVAVNEGLLAEIACLNALLEKKRVHSNIQSVSGRKGGRPKKYLATF